LLPIIIDVWLLNTYSRCLSPKLISNNQWPSLENSFWLRTCIKYYWKQVFLNIRSWNICFQIQDPFPHILDQNLLLYSKCVSYCTYYLSTALHSLRIIMFIIHWWLDIWDNIFLITIPCWIHISKLKIYSRIDYSSKYTITMVVIINILLISMESF